LRGNTVAEAFFDTHTTDLAVEVGTFALYAAARTWRVLSFEGWENRCRRHSYN
jgi:hypothetical protein